MTIETNKTCATCIHFQDWADLDGFTKHSCEIHEGLKRKYDEGCKDHKEK